MPKMIISNKENEFHHLPPLKHSKIDYEVTQLSLGIEVE